MKQSDTAAADGAPAGIGQRPPTPPRRRRTGHDPGLPAERSVRLSWHAAPPRSRRDGASWRCVVIILALGGLAAGLTKWGGGSMTPRLGLDLEGGTELVLQPQLTGTETISEGQVNRAVDIIRQRIDANGVSEAEITTQGGRSIVVSIPGQPTAEQLDAISKPSQLRFRAVYVQALDSNATPGQPERHADRHGHAARHAVGHGDRRRDRARPRRRGTATPSTSATAQNGVVPDALRAATTPATPAPTATATGAATTPAPAATPTAPAPTPGRDRGRHQDAGQHGSRGPRLGQGQGRRGRREGRQGSTPRSTAPRPGRSTRSRTTPTQPIATCGEDRVTKYVLGPSEIDGSEIADATSGYQPGPNGQPTSIVEVALSFKDAGKAKFADVTKRLYGLQSQPPLDQFAVVLDKAGHHGPAGPRRHHRRPGLDHRLVHHRLGQAARRAAEVRCAADLLRAADAGQHHAPAR